MGKEILLGMRQDLLLYRKCIGERRSYGKEGTFSPDHTEENKGEFRILYAVPYQSR